MAVEKLSNDYSKYLKVDLNSKLMPVNKSIDDMLARLEEFQTILAFAVQDRTDNNHIVSSIPDYKTELDDLCSKIDVVENLTTHIRSNLDKLEDDIEKAEAQLNCSETSTKVTNIFSPLFKKNTTEKKLPAQYLETFKTEDYFQ